MREGPDRDGPAGDDGRDETKKPDGGADGGVTDRDRGGMDIDVGMDVGMLADGPG